VISDRMGFRQGQPIGGDFGVRWSPHALLQCWPFCWWVGLILDHFSRRVVGVSVFAKEPTAQQICDMLDRAVERVGSTPKYTVTDQGTQFRSRYREWCKRHGVEPRFGAVGQHGSIAVIERFFLTLKSEAMWVITVPFTLTALRAELTAFVESYDVHRPHQTFGGRTPADVYEGLERVDERGANGATARVDLDQRIALNVSYLEAEGSPHPSRDVCSVGDRFDDESRCAVLVAVEGSPFVVSCVGNP
jgi:hypothetical protein